MQRNILRGVLIALCLLVQTVGVSFVGAEEDDPTTLGAASVTGAIATVLALPLKIATCGATVALGGVGYGLALGHSEFIQQELISSLPAACGARLDTIEVPIHGPQPREMYR